MENKERAEKMLAIMRSNKKHYKTERVLRHLIRYKRGLTSWTAWERYATTRLSSIIYNLRSDWHIDIVTIEEMDHNGRRYARYVLADYVREEAKESA